MPNLSQLKPYFSGTKHNLSLSKSVDLSPITHGNSLLFANVRVHREPIPITPRYLLAHQSIIRPRV